MFISLPANAGIWVQTHTIYYRAVEAGEQPRSDTTASRKGKGQPTKLSSRRKPDLLWNGNYIFIQWYFLYRISRVLFNRRQCKLVPCIISLFKSNQRFVDRCK